MPKKPLAEPQPEWKIKELAEKLGIENPHDLHLRVGGLSYPRAVKVWKGFGRLNADELTRFSRFFDCPAQNLISVPASLPKSPKNEK